MCRRPWSRRALAVAGALLALGTLPGAAQETPTEAELVRTLEELVPRWRAAQEEAARVVAERRADALARQAPLDTLRAGGVTVVVPAGTGEVARSVVEAAWEEHYAAWADGAPSPRPWLAFQWSSDPVRIRLPDRTLREVRGRRPWDGRATVEARVRDDIGILLVGRLRGTRLGHWIGRGSLAPVEDGADVYRRVALTASTPARACLGGDPAVCASALSLETDDFPFDEWYTPGERSLFVRQNRELWSNFPAQHADLDRCLAGDTEGCDRVLAFYRARQLGSGGRVGQPYWGAPLPGWVRATLLRQALERGGPGAWPRLLEAADMEPAQALEHASGVPADSLVAGWQRWLDEERPRRESTAGAASLPALLWALFILSFALRSTRWRLG